jgi:hypothetical protein
MQLTFLSGAGARLAKKFTKDGVTSYPLVKNVSSFTEEVDTIEKFYTALQNHAAEGHCLLKGQTTEPLINQSRRGMVDKNEPTGFLVLDFDGVEPGHDFKMPTTYDEDALLQISEYLISKLPEEFHEVSYIAQASSSFGRSTSEKISIHLFFLLEAYIHPKLLKTVVTGLNFCSDYWCTRTELSATGTALRFPVDRTITDNSRLIYIAPPIFTGGCEDPCNGWDRFALRCKRNPKLDLESAVRSSNPERIATRVRDRIRDIRRDSGLRNRKEVTRSVRVGEEHVTVVTNPDRLRMVVASDEGEFVRYNVNDGDSAAYWVHKHSPDIVYNFKGEPNFSFSAADPDGYEAHIEQFSVDIDNKDEGRTPVMFVDEDTGKYWFGRYNHAERRMDYLTQMPKSTLADFAVNEGMLMPDNVPVWSYRFEPFNDTVIDFKRKFLNKYVAPDHLREPVALPDDARAIQNGFASPVLESYCPTIHKILYSVCGCGVTELEYFVNWLAYVVQNRSKTFTAWVFHGMPGTGKGLLYNQILSPLLGEEYTHMKRQQDVEEKFNAWLEHSLMFVVDEFRVENSIRGQQNALVNKLKNMITETKGTIRGMGMDQVERPLYANMMFFSNDRDAVRIQEGDRRFNVAPRQETQIAHRYPELFKNNKVIEGCREELPLFAAFLLDFEVDDYSVRNTLENEAKEKMRVAAFTAADEFVAAVNHGNLDYFVPILEEDIMTSKSDYLMAAKNVVTWLIKDYDPDTPTRIFVNELRPLYNVLCGSAENEHRFSKLLSRHGLDTIRFRRDGLNKRGVEVHWKLYDNDIDDLKRMYVQEAPVPGLVHSRQ